MLGSGVTFFHENFVETSTKVLIFTFAVMALGLT